ncbi:MAG: hypothetical protein AB7G24_14730 [Novosphingobium sp.]
MMILARDGLSFEISRQFSELVDSSSFSIIDVPPAEASRAATDGKRRLEVEQFSENIRIMKNREKI